ncbi:hypothetical protein CR513_23546, partial [Mucuna pruriens]
DQPDHHFSPLQGIGDGSFRWYAGPPHLPLSVPNRKRYYQLQAIRGNLIEQLFSNLLAITIYTFQDLAIHFVLRFVANKAKMLEVANLFDIKKMKGEMLKQYLACFNNSTVQPANIEKIRARIEKHIEAEEDSTDRLEVEREG